MTEKPFKVRGPATTTRKGKPAGGRGTREKRNILLLTSFFFRVFALFRRFLLLVLVLDTHDLPSYGADLDFVDCATPVADIKGVNRLAKPCSSSAPVLGPVAPSSWASRAVSISMGMLDPDWRTVRYTSSPSGPGIFKSTVCFQLTMTNVLKRHRCDSPGYTSARQTVSIPFR